MGSHEPLDRFEYKESQLGLCAGMSMADARTLLCQKSGRGGLVAFNKGQRAIDPNLSVPTKRSDPPPPLGAYQRAA